MDDATLLAEELGSEKTRRRAIQKELDEAHGQIQSLRRRLWLKGTFLKMCGLVVGLGILAGAGWLCWKGLNSHETQHCYIERERQNIDAFTIYRTVEWGTDRELGFSTDLDKVMEISRKQGCKAPRRTEE
jgi:hypothetical protein